MLKEATQFEHQQYILYQRADSEGNVLARLAASLQIPIPMRNLRSWNAVTSVIPASQSVGR